MTRAHSRRVPKQARSLKRCEHILDIASKLFYEKGFEETTTNEIARRAGVSIGSLYQYFNNKEAIVGALTDRYVEALRGVTADVLARDVRDLPTAEAVDRFLDPIIKFHGSYPEFSPLWQGTQVSRVLRESMRGMDEEVLTRVEALIKARIPGIPDGRARVMATVMQAAVRSLVGLLGRSKDPKFKSRAAAETKRMLVAYVDEMMRRRKV